IGQPRRPGQQPGQRERLHLRRAPTQHPPIMINQNRDLLTLPQIDRQDRMIRPNHHPQRRNPLIAPTIPTGQPTTLGHERPPRCGLGLRSPSIPPGRTFPASTPPSTYEVFLRVAPTADAGIYESTVKAAGGVRTLDTLLALHAAGATR